MLKHYAGRKMLLMPVIGLLLGSCGQTTGISGASSACLVWPYVSWSDKDTDKTIADAKLNNARRDGWCKSAR